VSNKFQISNPKFQIMFQYRNSNDQSFWKLMIGAYLDFGAWDLVFIPEFIADD
jgi:hypothetical protein